MFTSRDPVTETRERDREREREEKREEQGKRRRRKKKKKKKMLDNISTQQLQRKQQKESLTKITTAFFFLPSMKSQTNGGMEPSAKRVFNLKLTATSR
jgi:hypothetical protein